MLSVKPGGVYLDGTLGGAGYSEAILRASSPDGMVIGVDLDEQAVTRAKEKLAWAPNRFSAFHRGFHEAKELLTRMGLRQLDGAVLDLGLSSDQLDDPERGFSFMAPGPLDMRFDRDQTEDLMELISRLSVKELEEIILSYSDERYFRRIARALKDGWRSGKLNTTTDLSNLISAAVKKRERRIHPATRTFQALRIAVNNEIGNLEKALEDIPELLGNNGRICVVSYHSIEDRAVKNAFRDKAKTFERYRLITKKPIRPEPMETRANPRARSARLRVLEAVK